MAVTNTIYPKTVTYNGNTYNSTNGGPITLSYTHDGTVVLDRTGSDEYATFVAVTDKILAVELTLRNNLFTSALGGAGHDLGFTFTGNTNTVNGTALNMVFVGAKANQDRAQPGTVVLSFTHLSADGTTNPIS